MGQTSLGPNYGGSSTPHGQGERRNYTSNTTTVIPAGAPVVLDPTSTNGVNVVLPSTGGATSIFAGISIYGVTAKGNSVIAVYNGFVMNAKVAAASVPGDDLVVDYTNNQLMTGTTNIVGRLLAAAVGGVAPVQLIT